MSDDLDQSRPFPPDVDPRRFGRRRLLLGAASTIPAVVAVRAGLRSGSAQTPPSGTPAAGSPVASPVADATPVASPVATPVPPYGNLTVIDDQRPSYPSAPVQGGDLRLALTGAGNSTYNPAAFRQDFQIMASYLDPLVWIDEVTMEPLPWLAESWEWSEDNTVITYTLRRGVRWHDDSPFHARDVVFSLYVYRDDLDSAVRNLFTSMESAEIIDQYTARVRLSQPDGNWLLNASSQFIFQRKQYNRHWNDRPEGQRTLSDFELGDTIPAGTGPWKIVDPIGEAITFERYETYWAGAPNCNTMSLTVMPEPEQRVTAWQAGEIDVLWPVSQAQLDAAKGGAGTVYIADTASVMFAAFNFNNPSRINPALFADLDLRRALSLAIDRTRYADSVFGGRIFPDRAGTVAQPWAHDTQVTNPAYDPDEAKNLLDEAGYEDRDGDGIRESGDGDVLLLRCILRNTARPELAAVLESIAVDLEGIGVRLEIARQSAERFDTEWIDEHTFDLIAFAYNLYPGFTDFDLYGSAWDIRQNIQGWNPGGYANETVDRAINDILEATSDEEMREALSTLQRETNDDLFGLWFGFPRDMVLVRPNVLGFQPNKQWQTWDTRKLWRTSTL